MMIDAHAHIAPHGNKIWAGQDASIETLVKQMDKSGVSKAVLLPIEPYVSSEFAYKEHLRFPERFICFISIDPHSKSALDDLYSHVKKYNPKGLKIHPRLQEFCPADPEIIKIVQKSGELGLTVLVDGWPGGSRNIENYSLPLTLGKLAKSAPSTNIIVAHCGGWKFIDAMLIAKDNHNVWLDTSFVLTQLCGTPFEDQLKFVLKKIGHEKLIFGTDFPSCNVIDSVDLANKVLDDVGFDNFQKEAVFSRNILQLLGVAP